MNLTLDKIKEILYGVARTEVIDGKLCLYRFTEKQTQMYRERSPENYYRKTFDTAGVYLEFETDSRSLGLSVEVARGIVKDFFVHSIYADGVRVGELSGTFADGENLIACAGEYALPEGMKRVKVYFPWTAASRIVSITLDDSALVKPVKKDRNILLFGDSITHGYVALQPENSYASRFVHHFNANGINKAIGGEVFWPELAATKDDALNPDTILVAYGTNDWRHTDKETLETNSRAFFANLRKTYPNAKIYALAPIWRSDLNTEVPIGPLANVAKHYQKIADELGGITVIDCIDFLPHRDDSFFDYYLHPNEAGFAHYAHGLIQTVEHYERSEKMNYWTLNPNNIYVAAHRGWPAKYPENTMESFRAAEAIGVDQLELDIRVTKDNELVIIHDATVDRTTDGTGLVCEKTLEELKALDAGSFKGEEFKGCKIPTLIEFMEFVKDNETITLDVELKEYPTEGREELAYNVCDRVLKIIDDYGFTDRVVLNTWSGKLNEYIFQKYGKKYRQHVYFPQHLMGECTIDPYSYAYCCCMFQTEEGKCVAPKEECDKMVAAGVQPWAGAGVNSEERVEEAIQKGAYLITCNNPDEILEILRKKGYHK